MATLISRMLKDESGLIAALIAVALITGASTLGNSINTQFNGLSTNLNVT
jgi:pilus assembly protein Flp/PilA